MYKRKKLTSIFFLFFIIFIFNSAIYAKSLLYISSYNYDWPSVSSQLKGFSENLDPIDHVNYLFMDTKQLSYSDAESNLLHIIKTNKIQYASYDCIVAVDDNAFDFVMKYKKKYFGDTSVVFFAVNGVVKAKKAAESSDISGIIEKAYYKETLDIAKAIYPKAHTILGITDNTESALGSRMQFEEIIKSQNLSIEYINTSELTSSEIANRLENLNNDTILFLLNFREDIDGNLYSAQNAAKFIFNHAAVPCFRTDYPGLEEGLLGGKILKFDTMGAQAAQLVNRYIAGEDMSSIKTLVTPGVVYLNNDVIVKFNLKIPSYILKNAQILNKHLSFIQKNYFTIILIFTIFSVFLLLFLLIFALKNSNIQKRQKIALEMVNYDLKTAYIQLKNAEENERKANSVKTDFLARMSHDMRTPLSAIIGLSDFGVTEKRDEKDYEYFSKIKGTSIYLLGLVNDILDMQQMETQTVVLTPGIYKLSNIINDIETIISTRAAQKNLNLTINTSLKEDSDFVVVDEKRFKQIFINLLNNAIKYTPAGKNIVFTVESTSQNDKILFSAVVEDNGVGMSAEFQSIMFNPFTKEQNAFSEIESGSGLGLSITKNLIKLMGGTIECKSKLNEGTQFYITLHLDKPSVKEIKILNQQVSAATDTKIFMNRHILLCEDNEINTEIARKLLEKKGFIVDCAKNGAIGVNLFKASKLKKNAGFDAILMDVRMPVMDGLEATKNIRKIDNKIPIIALSANAYKTDIDKSLEVGMNAHLMKPLDSHILFEKLAELIL